MNECTAFDTCIDLPISQGYLCEMKEAVPIVEDPIPNEDVDNSESLIETNCNISSRVKRCREIMKSKETDSQKVGPSFNYGRKRKCRIPNKTIKSSEISCRRPGPSSNCGKKRKQNPIKTTKLSDKGCQSQSLSLNSNKKSKSQTSLIESLNDVCDCDGMFPCIDFPKSLIIEEDYFRRRISIVEEDLIFKKKALIQRKQELESCKVTLELKYKGLNATKEFIRNSSPRYGAFIFNLLEKHLACVSSGEDIVKMYENLVIQAEKDVEDAKIRLEQEKKDLNDIIKYTSSIAKEVVSESDDEEGEW